MTTLETLTLIIASYGAILATFGFIRQHRLDRPMLKPSLNSILLVGPGASGGALVSIQVVNHGQRQALVSTITIELPDRRTLALTDAIGTQLPAVLQQGEVAVLRTSYRAVAEALMQCDYRSPVTITPMCRDSLGNFHRGKSWKVKPAEWFNT